ncbi:TIM barrel protein [Fontisphaera persica]|uniref:TIM barrel protein n=1 Tax=Fontisphaera persica TaxID=2974023 RepID=UPI0024C0D46A|nr:TIM barrel protein [Fontisphaera persica]WCJ60121.1 TIM barrel protein [Fontisphaera persica]
MSKTNYKFCFGPWNLSEGQDPYGPPTRKAQTFDWKLEQLKKHGFDAMMFHDDDAVPDIDHKSAAQIRDEAKALRRRLDDLGIAAEIVAPRLWFSPMTIDGAYTSNDPKCRQYAIERSKRCIDVARYLGTDLIVLWLAREGSYLREAKNARKCVDYLVEAIDAQLQYDKKIRIAIEPKPNEPMDLAYIPTIGHALALAQLTCDPKRVGCLIETAHAILAGLDPADEIDFAMSFGKLWSIHLNDQNGLKFDQDKPFGSANLRVAFNQVRALERNGYGRRGEYVAFDVHPFRTTKEEHWMAHLLNSRATFLRLVEKARTFDEKTAQKLIANRDYQALDQMVLEHLMGR